MSDGATRGVAADDASVKIRAPGPDDAGRMYEIERACFSDPWPAHSFVELCDGSRSDCWVADTNGQVVGYWVGQRIDDEAELANLAVAPEARGQGIGRLLLDDFIKTVGGLARTTIFLEVRVSNATAIRMYLTAGFAELTRRKGYYSRPVEDALVMARPAGPR